MTRAMLLRRFCKKRARMRVILTTGVNVHIILNLRKDAVFLCINRSLPPRVTAYAHALYTYMVFSCVSITMNSNVADTPQTTSRARGFRSHDPSRLFYARAVAHSIH